MKLLEKILVPVNLKNVSKLQIETSIELAQKFNSKIILAHILPEDAKRESVKEIIEIHINKLLQEIETQYRDKNILVEVKVSHGHLFDQIITISENENVNLILISNDLEHIDEKYNIDVMAEKLIRKSNKPVWVVKRSHTQIFKSIICSIDYSDASRRALNNAIKVARTFQSKLFIINVFEPLEDNYSLRYEFDFTQENKKLEDENNTKFNDFLDSFNLTHIDHEKTILKGKAYKEIINFIQQKQVNLLFMGTTGKNFLQRILMGSVTERVIRELPCSVVITKSDNILNLKIDSDISDIENHFSNAKKLEESGYYDEAIEQLLLCLQINDLHIPTLNALSVIYKKTGRNELADIYNNKIDQILKRLWDKKIELEIRKSLKI